jgi:hypothetical protein
VLSDIAFAESAQKRVAYGMAESISVGMAEESFDKGDFYSSEHQFTALDQTV